jgi:uncharacterized membrane protein
MSIDEEHAMALDRQPEIPSTAAIGGHPIHPMLVPLPITFLIAAFLCDLAFWATGDAFWARVAVWSVGAGIVGGALAAAAGFADYMGDDRVRAIGQARHHMMGNVLVMVLAVVSLLIRIIQGPEEGALPWGLLLSAIITAILSYTGWLGGELSYRHRVGVIPDGSDSRVRRL